MNHRDDDHREYLEERRHYEREEPRRHGRCAGWASWRDPCGATDCPTCYPGGEWAYEDEETPE